MQPDSRPEPAQLGLCYEVNRSIPDEAVLQSWGGSQVRHVRPLDEVDENLPRHPAQWQRCFRRNQALGQEIGQMGPGAPALHVFPLAPLPLLFHLGMLLDRYRVVGYQQRRGDGSFYAAFDTGAEIDREARSTAVIETEAPFFQVAGLPTGPQGGRGIVVVAIEVTRPIAQEFAACFAQQGPPLSQVVLTCSAGVGHEAFKGGAEALRAITELRAALDRIHDHLPGVEKVVLAMACPAALALALGRAVNPKSQHPLTLYNYRGGEGYVEVFTIDDQPVSARSRPPSGLLLLSQPVHLEITAQDCDEALPPDYRSLPRILARIDQQEPVLNALQVRDFSQAQLALEERFRSHVEPMLKEQPDYRIAYFGSAPVPLAMHLGFLIGTWRPVEVFQHHHGRRSWRWSATSAQAAPALKEVRLPKERDRTEGDVIIRVSASHVVDPHLTLQVVPEPLAEIDITLQHPDEDAFATSEDIEPVADAFKRALDAIAERFTRIKTVHVFASVQPGVAFLLGTRISDTQHPPVQTYQYVRGEEPPHYPAILINGPAPAAQAPLTEEQRAAAQRDRVRLEAELDRLRGLAENKRPQGEQSWIAALLGRGELLAGPWKYLPPLWETLLSQTRVDLERHQAPDSFLLEVDGQRWQIDDRWLAQLARRVSDQDRRLRALRMLVLHESVHRGQQGLESETSQEIGRFPKILEEIDYEADVWAMLHEYALARSQAPSTTEPPRAYFVKLIEDATECMWAFDDSGPPSPEVQIRRLHRYLIWYWQAESLARGTGTAEEMTLARVIEVLGQRPYIELAGPEIKAQKERVFYRLDRLKHPELAVYYQGRLSRHGTRPGLEITEILEGVRRRDGHRIRKALRGAVAHTLRD